MTDVEAVPVADTVARVAAALRARSYSFADEYQLQAAVGEALTTADMTHRREESIDPHRRIDFMVFADGARVGLEVKVQGGTGDVARQVDSYLDHGSVDGLVLITTRPQHQALSGVRNGKPVNVVHVSPLNGLLSPAAAPVVASGTLKLDGDHWVIDAEPHLVIRLKRVFPRIRHTHTGQILIAATDEVARDLEWLMDRWPLAMDPASAAALADGAARHEQRGRQVASILAGDTLDDGEFRIPAREPRWAHQVRNADMITAVHRLLVTDQLGSGKTFSALTTLRNPGSLPALIVCPTHLPLQWQREITATWPDMTVHIAKSRTPYDLPVPPDIMIVPYSKLDGWAEVLVGHPNTVIFDEAHELRNGVTTLKGHAATVIAQNATYVCGLTATPIFNYGGDIHNIMGAIRPSVLGTRDEFLREWCGVSDGNKPRVANPAALASYLRAEGAMVGATLPPTGTIRMEHVVESDPEVFERLAGDISAMAASILDPATETKERWRMSGEFDMRMRQATGVAKAPYVATFVEMLLQTVDKVVLFGWHRATYSVWMERLAKYGAAMYTGTESPKQKEATVDRFVNGDSRVMIISLRSGAGLDGLQAVSHTAVFGELDWSPAVHDQAIGRLDRPGQEHGPVLAYFVTSEVGADPTMISVLGVKEMQAAPFVNKDIAQFGGGDQTDRIKELAAAVLERNGPPTPKPEPVPKPVPEPVPVLRLVPPPT